MWIVFHLLTKLFDLLLALFVSFPPVVGLIWISVLTAVIMLMVYRHISNQEKIKQTKDRIKAHFLEVRLFKDDIRVILAAQWKILLNNLKYMSLALKPMLFMLPAIILILIQLEGRYAHRPLHPGETTIIAVHLEEDPTKGNALEIELPEGLALESPALRISKTREVNWRIRAEKKGRYELKFKLKEEAFLRNLFVADENLPIARQVKKNTIIEQIFQPFERPLDKSGAVRSIEIQYPEADIRFFGWSLNWLVGFFVFSIIFGFAMKGVFKVEI